MMMDSWKARKVENEASREATWKVAEEFLPDSDPNIVLDRLNYFPFPGITGQSTDPPCLLHEASLSLSWSSSFP